MAKKVRIYELAKEYNMPAKEMVAKLKEEFGLEIKSHMSVLSGDELELVRSYFEEDEEETKEEKKAPSKKPEKSKKNIKINLQEEDDEEEDKPSQKHRKKKKNRKAKKNKGKKTTKVDTHIEIEKAEQSLYQNQSLLRLLQTRLAKIQTWL